MAYSSLTLLHGKADIGGYAELSQESSHGAVHIKPYLDSTDLYRCNKFSELRKRLQRDGYLYIRNVIPKEKILRARQVVAEVVYKVWGCLDIHALLGSTRSLENPVLVSSSYHPSKTYTLTGFSEIVQDTRIRSAFNGPELTAFFTQLFSSDSPSESNPKDPLIAPRVVPSTLPNHWVRVKGPGQSTDVHSDYYQFAHVIHQVHDQRVSVESLDTPGSSTNELDSLDDAKLTSMYTCWAPLSDLKASDGTVALLEKSHSLIDLDQPIGTAQSLRDYIRRLELGDLPDPSSSDEKGPEPDGLEDDLVPGIDAYEVPAPLLKHLPLPDAHRLSEWSATMKNCCDLQKCSRDGDISATETEFAWRCGDVEAGDIVVFDMRLCHASTRNESDRLMRLSVDTRWLAMPTITATSSDTSSE